MNWLFDNTGYGTAEDNMRYDEHLADHLVADTRIFRMYEWPTVAITLPSGRYVPDGLEKVDHSIRCSGGGILFHSPGDLVFSVVTAVDDSLWPKLLKDKMGRLTDYFETMFHMLSLDVHRSQTEELSNRQFCNHYYNPFELYWKKEKVLALALRRLRHVLVVQGIVHLQNGHHFFEPYVPLFGDFISKGFDGSVSFDAVVKGLKQQVSGSF